MLKPCAKTWMWNQKWTHRMSSMNIHHPLAQNLSLQHAGLPDHTVYWQQEIRTYGASLGDDNRRPSNLWLRTVPSNDVLDRTTIPHVWLTLASKRDIITYRIAVRHKRQENAVCHCPCEKCRPHSGKWQQTYSTRLKKELLDKPPTGPHLQREPQIVQCAEKPHAVVGGRVARQRANGRCPGGAREY
jgi:hypothetical protein